MCALHHMDMDMLNLCCVCNVCVCFLVENSHKNQSFVQLQSIEGLSLLIFFYIGSRFEINVFKELIDVPVSFVSFVPIAMSQHHHKCTMWSTHTSSWNYSVLHLMNTLNGNQKNLRYHVVFLQNCSLHVILSGKFENKGRNKMYENTNQILPDKVSGSLNFWLSWKLLFDICIAF